MNIASILHDEPTRRAGTTVIVQDPAGEARRRTNPTLSATLGRVWPQPTQA
jgi:hypothetical protein